MKKALLVAAIVASTGVSNQFANAAQYTLDPAHTFITFRVKHLGLSWLHGRFNDVNGSFDYDANNEASSNIIINVNTASVDSNHAERDKHLRSDDFLDVSKYPTASFKSSSFDGKNLNGELTLHGVTKPISIEISKLGEGKDPWGGYRAGFVGTYNLKRSDFGISYDLGPAAEVVEMQFNLEGVRNK